LHACRSTLEDPPLGGYISSAIAILKPEWGWHSYLSEVLFLLGFVLLGQVILDWAKASTAQEIKSLLKLQPQIAHKITPAGIVDIPAIAVQVGDRLLVKAGEAIPTDGIVLEGTTAVDEAMLTGESMPVTKGTELEFVIMVIAVSCVKLLSAHNSTQHTSRKHKV
jgi:ATPase, P-type (transporting), HAD superfamily, subfamily IC